MHTVGLSSGALSIDLPARLAGHGKTHGSEEQRGPVGTCGRRGTYQVRKERGARKGVDNGWDKQPVRSPLSKASFPWYGIGDAGTKSD